MPERFSRAELAELVACLPKVELHLHLEGTLEPAMMLALAKRNGVDIPYRSVSDAEAAYRFTGLASFLSVYYEATSVLLHERDFEELTFAYLTRMNDEGVRHVEPFFDPQAHTARGVAFDTVVAGIVAGLERGKREYGISWRLIMSFLRDLSAESALSTLDSALPWLEKISGVGLDSAEVGNPPDKFAGVYARCAELGLKLTAHAGEEGDAAAVADALDTLGVQRIDHGVHSADDAALMRRLARDRITLTVCPFSNVRLHVYESLKGCPVKRFLDEGVRATVNSDDPAYFGGYLSENLLGVAEALELSRADVIQLVRNSIDGCWADDDRKAELLAELAAVAG